MLKNKSSKTKKVIIKLAVLLLWLGVWQGAFMLVNKEILLASPLQVLERIAVLSRTSGFWKSVLLSFTRIIAGYVLAVITGTSLAALTSASKILRELFAPVLSVIRSTPVASFIILVLVWIRKTYVPVFIVFLIVLPVIWANVSEGIESTDKSLLEVARVYDFGFFKTVRTVYFHSVLPTFAAGCTTALGLAWKSGVAAEVIAQPIMSIGYNLYRSKIYIETADLFAWTTVVIILSFLLEKLIKRILKRKEERENA